MGIPSSAIASALEGLGNSQAMLNKATERLARVADPSIYPGDVVSLSDEMITLLAAKNAYEVNLKTVQMANEMEQHMIDVLG